MASLDSQDEIVLIELSNPEEARIWESENESVPSRQHTFLQLLPNPFINLKPEKDNLFGEEPPRTGHHREYPPGASARYCRLF